MNAILPLAAQDALQLNADELAALTGTPQAALQIDWLNANGWAFSLTRAGKPVVGRLYANLKLSGVDVATIVAPGTWQPDLNALQ